MTDLYPEIENIELAALTSLGDRQIGVMSGNDADLGFRMWGGKDGNSDTTLWLAKDQDARVADLSLTGAFTGNLQFSTDGAIISSNTSDSSDNKELVISGGGGSGVTRGAYIQLSGNEDGNTGRLLLRAGGVAGSKIDFSAKADGSTQMLLDENGNLGVGTNTPVCNLHVKVASVVDTLTEAGRISGGNYDNQDYAESFIFYHKTASLNTNRGVAFKSINGDFEIQTIVSSSGASDTSNHIALQPDGGKVRIAGTGAPACGLHLGSGSSSHSLTNNNDALISGKLEVEGIIYADGGVIESSVAGITVGSTTSALQASTMTTTQRDALSPANGMIIYNSTTSTIQGYSNGSWQDMGDIT